MNPPLNPLKNLEFPVKNPENPCRNREIAASPLKLAGKMPRIPPKSWMFRKSFKWPEILLKNPEFLDNTPQNPKNPSKNPEI